MDIFFKFKENQIDWCNCPFPPQGDLLDRSHPLYDMIFIDREPLPNGGKISINSKSVEDILPINVPISVIEIKQKAWSVFIEDNPTIHKATVQSITQRWAKVMGKYGRAVGALNIYSTDLRPWEPEMGVWHLGMGPYDYLHPLNENLPPWQALIALNFHRFLAEDPTLLPLYPRTTKLLSSLISTKSQPRPKQ